MSDQSAGALPEPKFRKTKSEKWAVMAPVVTLEAALAGDGKVKVLKKSGDYSSFVVGSLGKPFDVDGVMMCYGYAPGDENDGGGGSGDPSGSSRNRSSVADRPPVRDQAPPPSFTAAPPPRDETEPLPEYQGSSEDEWVEEF